MIRSDKHEHFLYPIMMPPLLLLDGERWDCPFGSSLSCSDCAYKASRKLEAVNRGQVVLWAVKQLCVWLKTTLSWNINIPAGSRPCTQPLQLHRQPRWTRETGRGWEWGVASEKDGRGGESYMTWQKYWKWYLYEATKGGIQWRCTDREVFYWMWMCRQEE